jgi:hypothetical protein
MAWVAVAIGGAAVVTAGAGMYSSSQASSAMAGATKGAQRRILTAQREAIAADEKALERQIELNEPFRQMGLDVIPQLMLEIKSGAPTFDEFVQSPEAASIREQELNDIRIATERSAAAKGNLFAPSTQMELQKRAMQITASSKLGQYENVLSRRDRQLNDEFNLVNIGRGATTQQTGAIRDSGSNISNIISNTGTNMANLDMAKGEARASGYINTGNVIGNAITSGVSNYLSYQANQPAKP